MLTCKGIVVTKNAKGDMEKMQSYDRVYFAYGPNDEVVEQGKMVNDKEVGKVTKPKADKSVHPSRELLKAALDFIQTEYPKSDPVTVLLESADYGFDLKRQAPIRAALSPSKPVDEDKANEKMAKTLVAMGKFPTLDAALVFLRALQPQSVAA